MNVLGMEPNDCWTESHISSAFFQGLGYTCEDWYQRFGSNLVPQDLEWEVKGQLERKTLLLWQRHELFRWPWMLRRLISFLYTAIHHVRYINCRIGLLQLSNEPYPIRLACLLQEIRWQALNHVVGSGHPCISFSKASTNQTLIWDSFRYLLVR